MKRARARGAKRPQPNAAFEQPRRFLGGLSPEQFLVRHWQRAPLLVRGALDVPKAPVSRAQLLRLAQRQDVEARLVSVVGETWQLERGPLEREQLASLGASDWTVLVSDLEQHAPEVAPLLNELDFLPSWRVDDVMASYATPGGSVGPHYDSYDVFLLQVHGQRRWQISERFDRTDVRDDTPLCILRNFEFEHEWVLGPGDMLYLPPKVAHYGVAEGEAITFSLGCRAPGLKELATQFALTAIDRAPTTPWSLQRPRRAQPRESLDPQHARDVERELRGLFEFDREACLRGLGSLVSQPKALFSLEADEPPSARVVQSRLSGKAGLVRRQGSRWLLVRTVRAIWLYVDGAELECTLAPELAQLLAQGKALSAARVRAALRDSGERMLLHGLVSAGQLLPAPKARAKVKGGPSAAGKSRGVGAKARSARKGVSG